MADKSDIELVDPTAPGFVDKVTPKKDGTIFLFSCSKIIKPEDPGTEPPSPDYPNNIEPDKTGPYRTPGKPAVKCEGVHFRHAGYVEMLLPYMKPGGVKEVIVENRQVMVCVKCRSSYVWDGNQMHDITNRIDLNAWETAEVELNKATGPGGEC